MKQHILSAFMLVLVICTFNVSSVAAQAIRRSNHSSMLAKAKPLQVDCSQGCYALTEWGHLTDYPVHGASTTVQVSNPAIYTTNGYFLRDIELQRYNDFWTAAAGIEKDSSANSGDRCSNQYGAGLWYFAIVWNAQYNIYYRQCWSVPSHDINKTTTFQIGYYVSGGGGMLFIMDNAFHDAPCEKGCYVSGAQQTYDHIWLFEYTENAWSGHNVWGVDWGYNKYQGMNGSWNYQPGACISNAGGCANPSNPPQMYWERRPQDSTTGGDLYSCEYDTGNSCVFGS